MFILLAIINYKKELLTEGIMTVKELKEALKGYDDEVSVFIKYPVYDPNGNEFMSQKALIEVEADDEGVNLIEEY